METPLVSVIVLTHRRPRVLALAIESVLRAGNAVECWVVVNGIDDPETIALLRGYGDRVRTRVIAAEPNGSARNHAIHSARGEWLLFLDDDAFLSTAWLEQVEVLIERHRDADVIAGPNLTPPESSPFQVAVGKALASRFGAYTSSRRYQDRMWRGDCGEESVMLCNLLIRRSALIRTGIRFDPALPCAEENILVKELELLGSRVIFDSEFFVFHERRSTGWGLARQVFKYGVGRATGAWLLPSSLRWPHVVPSAALVWVTLAGPIAAFLAMAVYAGAVFVQVARHRDVRLALIFPLIHFSYGIGFLVGLIPYGLLQRRFRRVLVRASSVGS